MKEGDRPARRPAHPRTSRSAPGSRRTSGARFFASQAPALRALPFSEAVRAGDFLFVSGQIGSAPGTAEPVPGGIAAESRRAMENVREVLRRRGASLHDVVKFTVYLADIGEWSAFNEVYRRFFGERFPARSALGASGLAKGARVELDCVAYAPGRRLRGLVRASKRAAGTATGRD
jgi:2-iminobutanoate/2-iminopropanoate deaminase